MNDANGGAGKGGNPSGSGGEKKGRGPTAMIVAVVVIGAVIIGGPKLKALLGMSSADNASDGSGATGKKKTRKVKKTINGEEREVDEVVDDDSSGNGSGPPTDLIERAKWEAEQAALKKLRTQDMETYVRESRLGSDTHAMGEDGVGYEGIVKPNARHESPMSLSRISTNPANKDRPPPSDDKNMKFVVLTGSAYNIYPGVPMDARLTVTQGNPQIMDPQRPTPAPLTINLVSARLTKRAADGKVTVVGDFPLNDRGKDGDQDAGDKTYSGVLDPARMKGLDGTVTLNVVFTVAGDAEEYAVPLDWNVVANPHAKIIGPTGDALNEKGSLDVNVSVDVTQPGEYFFQGVLRDAKGADIGWTEARPTLDKGKQNVTFTYFGLLFQEKKVDGPYTFSLAYGTHIFGADHNETLSVPEWSGSYTTKPYKFSQFTSEESQDPARQQRIKDLQEMVAKNPAMVNKDGPDMVLTKDGLVPANGRPTAPTYPHSGSSEAPPLETNKPYTPDNAAGKTPAVPPAPPGTPATPAPGTPPKP